MPGFVAIEDLILSHDPEFPQERLRSAGVAAVSKNPGGRLPDPEASRANSP
jgi:hypothetical protein